MGAFYVGQRVRKVRGLLNIGMEGIVAALNPQRSNGRTVATVYPFAAYGANQRGMVREVPAGTLLWANPNDLEPIIPEGLESLAEINALYEPEPVQVSEVA